jgi:predicted RNA-binding Zn-ribbon protein involved in translation (DUF1610 family)
MELRIPDQIRTDGGTQSRFKIDQPTVDDYADAMKAGDQFPPLDVYYDGEVYWLADGFHRLHAALQIGRETITVDVKQGTLRDAILYSVGVNATHGLRRTNDDKRRAVICLLRDPEWSQWSDREIGRRCRVSNRFVSNLRKYVVPDPYNPTVNGTQIEKKVIRGGTEYTMNTANIGQKSQPDLPPPPEPEKMCEHCGKRRANVTDMPYCDKCWHNELTDWLKCPQCNATSTIAKTVPVSDTVKCWSCKKETPKQEWVDYTAQAEAEHAALIEGKETNSTPAPLEVWQLERYVTDWLNHLNSVKADPVNEPLRILTAIKEKERGNLPTPLWQAHLGDIESYLKHTLKLTNYNKRDLIQACHNLLEQLRQEQIAAAKSEAVTITPEREDEATPGNIVAQGDDGNKYSVAEELPAGVTPVVMRGHWYCGRCDQKYGPGTRYWVKGYTKPVCQTCLEEVSAGQIRYSIFECPKCNQPKVQRLSGSPEPGKPLYSCHNCGQIWDTSSQFFTAFNEAEAQAGDNGHTTPDAEQDRQPAGTILGIELSLGELEHLQYVCRNNAQMNEAQGRPGLAKLFTQLRDQAEHTIRAKKERLAV